MNSYRVIGCMTGTSCDGLDLAYIETNGADKLIFGPAETIPFDPAFQKILRQRVGLRLLTHYMDEELEKSIAIFHKQHIEEFISHHQLTVDAIGFHGQSVWHDPPNQKTVQLGDSQHLADLLGIQVVGQFRQADVKSGGQGAPLVPIYHQALAAKLEKPTAFLNIGGVANITYIAADNQLAAGDTGPGNALVDDWVLKHTGVAQDTDGAFAEQGLINQNLLDKWIQDPFFEKPFPKSLDRMHFHYVLDDCNQMGLYDGAATLTQFTVEAIMKALAILPAKPNQLVVCGGGCHNAKMMNTLEERFENLISAYDIGFDADAIEAQLMAYLAARFFENLPSSFSGTTGVPQPTIAGQLFRPHSS